MPIFRKDGKKVLFIHVPKTGGGSIERLFRDSGWRIDLWNGSFKPDSLNHLTRTTPQHMDAFTIQRTLRIDRFDLVFMFVRHPFSRFRSEYLWRLRKAKSVDVSEPVVERWALKSFADFAANEYLWDNHLRPQVDFYLPGAHVFRYEHGLESAMDELSRVYELPLDGSLGRAHSDVGPSGNKSSDVQLSELLTARLRDFYWRDFEFFGYSSEAAAGSERARLTSELAHDVVGRYEPGSRTAASEVGFLSDQRILAESSRPELLAEAPRSCWLLPSLRLAR